VGNTKTTACGTGGARASSQQTGGNGAAGQVILSYLNRAATPAITGWSLAGWKSCGSQNRRSTDRKFVGAGCGDACQPLV